ncbi:MAG: peptide-N-glycosidase [Cytophagales bacterium]|nr:peptide-N-glycosidase [Cytophagales bacterium]
MIPHNRTTITTDPSRGSNPYPAWGVFPKEGASIRKIMMHVTLGSPDSLPTAHWDYRDHINILRKGGSRGEKMNYELGRMLTPYGSIFSKGWEFTWSVDVTDFSLILRDSVEIEYVHTGYEPTTVGWALTIDFEITYGPQHIIPLSIAPMWRGSFNYGNPEKPIEKELTPMSYSVTEGSKLNRLRIQHTGHGMDRPRGCSEFCSRWRKVLLDGKVVQEKDLWKQCGDNPLYPQGGTWIFDRALWCPGDLQQPDIIDVKPGGTTHTFSIEMEPYTATENIQAKEDISACLIQYSAPINKYDVAVESIIVPNNRPLYLRSNPKAVDAKIVIRNLGSENLKSLTISYGTDGFDRRKYVWKGELGYNAAKEITLPGTIEYSGAEHTFTVECSRPNGKKDAWKSDNVLSSTFDAPKDLPEDLVVQFKTNKNPTDNDLFIINSKSDTVYWRKAETLLPDTVYSDTLHLAKDLYEMYLADTAGNGLEFWFMRNQGYGYVRIYDIDGKSIHKFQSDCGDGEMLAFATSHGFSPDSDHPLYDFILFPKIISDTFSLDVYTEKSEDMEVVLLKEGTPVEKHVYPKSKGGNFKYDISHLEDGRYIVEVMMNGDRKFKTRINKNRKWNY